MYLVVLYFCICFAFCPFAHVLLSCIVLSSLSHRQLLIINYCMMFKTKDRLGSGSTGSQQNQPV